MLYNTAPKWRLLTRQNTIPQKYREHFIYHRRHLLVSANRKLIFVLRLRRHDLEREWCFESKASKESHYHFSLLSDSRYARPLLHTTPLAHRFTQPRNLNFTRRRNARRFTGFIDGDWRRAMISWFQHVMPLDTMTYARFPLYRGRLTGDDVRRRILVFFDCR